jgi:hypothetical protein
MLSNGVMNHKQRRKPRRNSDRDPGDCWGYKKNHVLDYFLKKDFIKQRKTILREHSSTEPTEYRGDKENF